MEEETHFQLLTSNVELSVWSVDVTLDDLKTRVCAAIDARRDTIEGIAREILASPETGYREEKTAKIVARAFRDLGLEPREGLAMTGVRADLPSSGSGPTIAILGELDALGVPDNPRADPVTGAVHACGHNAQIASMLGAGHRAARVGRARRAWRAGWCLFAVPAEEYVEIEYRLD